MEMAGPDHSKNKIRGTGRQTFVCQIEIVMKWKAEESWAMQLDVCLRVK